jgi:hypothetical protein
MLNDGLTLETGFMHVLHLVGDKLHLRLEVESGADSTEDEKFTLIGFRGDAREYAQTRTTKDDVDPSDEFWEFVFTDLIPDLNYSLEIEPGEQAASDDGEPGGDADSDKGPTQNQGEEKGRYFCFEDVPWTEFEKALES